MTAEHQYDSPVKATLAGIKDALGRGPKLELTPTDRLDGARVLITGGNRGLGAGIAELLAERGADLTLAIRSGGEDAADELRERTGHPPIRALPLDLSDPASIDALVDTLSAGEPFDRVVLNAGVVPLQSRQTPAGLDLMFHVNFLGHSDLVEKLLDAGLFAEGSRLVVVSSEAHRQGKPTLDDFGVPETYGTGGVMPHYSQSKIYLTAWTRALSRAVPADQIGVFALCPGAVASSIAREAPGWMQLWLKPAMKLFFQSPRTAAEPVEWLCCTPSIEGTTGRYWHMHREKEPHPWTDDPKASAEVREQAKQLSARIREG